VASVEAEAGAVDADAADLAELTSTGSGTEASSGTTAASGSGGVDGSAAARTRIGLLARAEGGAASGWLAGTNAGSAVDDSLLTACGNSALLCSAAATARRVGDVGDTDVILGDTGTRIVRTTNCGLLAGDSGAMASALEGPHPMSTNGYRLSVTSQNGRVSSGNGVFFKRNCTKKTDIQSSTSQEAVASVESMSTGGAPTTMHTHSAPYQVIAQRG
jgi:hypothetical protein